MSKRQLIIETAIEIFAQKGFEATSIQEITEKCGISKGAFYLSFKSKDELIISIISHFMTQLSNTFDQLVNNKYKTENKMYLLYMEVFKFLQTHRSFALLFAMEQTHQVNKELFDNLTSYTQQFDMYILKLLEQQYGASIEPIKYDLLICVQGFITTHAKFVMLQTLPKDLSSLAYSLVEKTTIIATYSKTSYFTEELLQIAQCTNHQTFTLQQMLEKIALLLQDTEHAEPLEVESLQILQEQLQSNDKNSAIMHGMINNLKHFPRCRLLITQLEHFLMQN